MSLIVVLSLSINFNHGLLLPTVIFLRQYVQTKLSFLSSQKYILTTVSTKLQ